MSCVSNRRWRCDPIRRISIYEFIRVWAMKGWRKVLATCSQVVVAFCRTENRSSDPQVYVELCFTLGKTVLRECFSSRSGFFWSGCAIVRLHYCSDCCWEFQFWQMFFEQLLPGTCGSLILVLRCLRAMTFYRKLKYIAGYRIGRISFNLLPKPLESIRKPIDL